MDLTALRQKLVENEIFTDPETKFLLWLIESFERIDARLKHGMRLKQIEIS